MAFHNKDIHGPMRQCTLYTRIESIKDYSVHDEKVNIFNTQNQVWFNSTQAVVQHYAHDGGSSLMMVTVCLYTYIPQTQNQSKGFVV